MRMVLPWIVSGARCKKLPASIVEFADLGRVHDSSLAIGPIEPPLMRLSIVPTERQALDVAGSRALGFELLQLSAAIPNLSGDGGAVKIDPLRRAP